MKKNKETKAQKETREFVEMNIYDLKLYLDFILEQVVLEETECTKEDLVRWVVSAKKAVNNLESFVNVKQG